MIEAGYLLKAILVADKESIELRKALKEFIVRVEDANKPLLDKYKPPLTLPINLFKIQDVVDRCFGFFHQPIQ
ncbi:MAG: hypothetical protein RBG13Loki_4424 [Promethearchaeota archaeon CR_4]|nr:MAG: hypothetical protein RBG13Loki_4424 [Candidatus Lokiarchaeota archaeon CR_4]